MLFPSQQASAHQQKDQFIHFLTKFYGSTNHIYEFQVLIQSYLQTQHFQTFPYHGALSQLYAHRVSITSELSLERESLIPSRAKQLDPKVLNLIQLGDPSDPYVSAEQTLGVLPNCFQLSSVPSLYGPTCQHSSDASFTASNEFDLLIQAIVCIKSKSFLFRLSSSNIPTL